MVLIQTKKIFHLLCQCNLFFLQGSCFFESSTALHLQQLSYSVREAYQNPFKNCSLASNVIYSFFIICSCSSFSFPLHCFDLDGRSCIGLSPAQVSHKQKTDFAAAVSVVITSDDNTSTGKHSRCDYSRLLFRLHFFREFVGCKQTQWSGICNKFERKYLFTV